jgi:hypothetical protein
MLRRALASLFAKPAPVELTPEQFTEAVAKALRDDAPYSDVTIFAPLVIDVSSPDHMPQTLSLGRQYDMHCADPGRLDTLIFRQIVENARIERLQGVVLDTDLILPAVVRSADVADLDPDQDFVDPISEHLALVYVFDHPTQSRRVTAADLETMELDRSALLPVAVGNLERIAHEATVEWHGALAVIESESLSPAALIASIDYWSTDTFAAYPTLTAIAPRRSTLIVFDPNDAAAHSDATALADEIVATEGDAALATDVVTVKDQAPLEPQ